LREQAANIAECFPEFIDGSGISFPKPRFEFGEGHLDWVQVRPVRRQEEQPCTFGPDSVLSLLTCVGRQIVEYDDITRLEDRGELGFNIGVEDHAFHRRIDDPWSDKAIAFEARNQGLGAPVAKGGLGKQSLPFQASSHGFCHLGVGAGFVEKDQPPAMFTHLGLAALFPFCPSLDQVRPVFF
jgi:hypothetical protein